MNEEEKKDNSLYIKNLAKDIFDTLGGADNLISAKGNITRVKLTLLEPNKFDYQSLVSQKKEDLLGALDRLDNENAIYLVTKPNLADLLAKELKILKEKKEKN